MRSYVAAKSTIAADLRVPETRRHIITPDTYPFAGDLYVFRGRKGDFLKVLWHDGLGLSLYAKRLERGKFIWPSPADGVV